MDAPGCCVTLSTSEEVDFLLHRDPHEPFTDPSTGTTGSPSPAVLQFGYRIQTYHTYV